MKIKKVVVLGYAKEKFLRPGWKKETTGCCYWCGRRDGEVALCPFRMLWGKVEVVNLACRKCYREFSGLAESVKKDKSSKKKGRTK